MWLQKKKRPHIVALAAAAAAAAAPFGLTTACLQRRARAMPSGACNWNRGLGGKAGRHRGRWSAMLLLQAATARSSCARQPRCNSELRMQARRGGCFLYVQDQCSNDMGSFSVRCMYVSFWEHATQGFAVHRAAAHSIRHALPRGFLIKLFFLNGIFAEFPRPLTKALLTQFLTTVFLFNSRFSSFSNSVVHDCVFGLESQSPHDSPPRSHSSHKFV